MWLTNSNVYFTKPMFLLFNARSLALFQYPLSYFYVANTDVRELF